MTTKESSGWYPGKYVRRFSRRDVTSPESPQKVSSDSQLISEENLNTDDVVSTASNTTRNSSKSVGLETVGKIDFPLFPVIGEVKIDIFDLKYLSVTKPRLVITVEGVSKSLVSWSNICTETFNFTDISSDILITIVDESAESDVVGRIIVPIIQFIGLTKTVKPKRQLRQFFPFLPASARLKSNGSEFQSGLKDVPGSSMIKTKEAIGFLDSLIEVSVFQSPPASLYFLPSTNVDKAKCRCSGCSNLDTACVLACIDRDVGRLQRAFSPFPVVSSLLFFPEVFVLIVLCGLACIWLRTHEVPFLLFIILLYNGILAKSRRSFQHVTVWSRSRGGTSVKGVSGAADDGLRTLACSTSGWAAAAEWLQYVLSFADTNISFMCYGVLLILSCISSFVLWLGLGRMLLFGSLSGLLCCAACSPYSPESWARIKALSQPRGASDGPAGRLRQAVRRVVAAAEGLANCCGRVPDDLLLTHRHICSLAVVNPLGPEISDAAAAASKTD